MLQLLNTEGNLLRTKAYMGFKNVNTFLSQDHRRCRSGVESFGNSYRANGAAVEGLADRNCHRKKEVGKGKSVSWGGA